MDIGQIAIVAPCFNEGITAISFLKELEKTLVTLHHSFIVIVVDDSSLDNTLELLEQFTFKADNLALHVLSLKFNLGHQGAIYQACFMPIHEVQRMS